MSSVMTVFRDRLQLQADFCFFFFFLRLNQNYNHQETESGRKNQLYLCSLAFIRMTAADELHLLRTEKAPDYSNLTQEMVCSGGVG